MPTATLIRRRMAAQRHIHHQSPMPVMVAGSGIIKKLLTAIGCLNLNHPSSDEKDDAQEKVGQQGISAGCQG
jgi:hypothetical protein